MRAAIAEVPIVTDYVHGVHCGIEEGITTVVGYTDTLYGRQFALHIHGNAIALQTSLAVGYKRDISTRRIDIDGIGSLTGIPEVRNTIVTGVQCQYRAVTYTGIATQVYDRVLTQGNGNRIRIYAGIRVGYTYVISSVLAYRPRLAGRVIISSVLRAIWLYSGI